MIKVTLFSQIISKLDSSKFKSLVKQHQTDKHQKGFNCWFHLVPMLFCKLAEGYITKFVEAGLIHSEAHNSYSNPAKA